MSAPTGQQYELVLGNQTAVVTEVGATLRAYTVDGRDVVTSFPADGEPQSCQGQQLMPWPNRIRDGRWVLDGVEHQLPLNEPDRGNAIHGLVFDKPFTVVAQDEASLTQRLLLEPTDGWPGTLELLVRHTLSEGGLGIEVTAHNVGELRVPFGYAAHPYLASPDGTPIDECTVLLPFDDYVEVDERLLPIARALAMDPTVILFDEPTSALDPEMVNEVLEVMVQLAAQGMTMVVVTHEMGFARRAGHRIVFLADGQVVEQADPETFFANPQSERAKDFLSKILAS